MQNNYPDSSALPLEKIEPWPGVNTDPIADVFKKSLVSLLDVLHTIDTSNHASLFDLTVNSLEGNFLIFILSFVLYALVMHTQTLGLHLI